MKSTAGLVQSSCLKIRDSSFHQNKNHTKTIMAYILKNHNITINHSYNDIAQKGRKKKSSEDGHCIRSLGLLLEINRTNSQVKNINLIIFHVFSL